MDRETFFEAYVTAALWSSHVDPFGTCPQCGKDDKVLCRWNAERKHVCMDCSTREPDYEPPADDNYSMCDIDDETLASMRADCNAFQADNADLLEQWSDAGRDEASAGHDFWLTRNRHGVGYWDRFSRGTEEGKIGDKLTEKAQAYGESNLYVSDDGKLRIG